jgi:hypothetical protein
MVAMTFKEHYQKLQESNPENKPMSLEFIGAALFPDMSGANSHHTKHNGGCTKREYAAAALMGRMSKQGFVKRPQGWNPSKTVSLWQWVKSSVQPTARKEVEK